MRHRWIKKVITKKNKVMYYLGDGFWFGRISKQHAEEGLAEKKYSLWATVDKREELPDAYITVDLTSLATLPQSNMVH